MGNLSYAIIGTGALGGFYGAKLQNAGSEVHFLLNSDYEQVSQNGLIIQSKDGDFMLPQVNAYNNVEKMPPCDVVIVALKTTKNYLLPQLLPPVIKDNGTILVLQNGLDIETEIAQIVKNVTIIGGLCFLCSNKVGAGHIHHLDYGQITLGEYAVNYQQMGITSRMQEICQDFENAGIKIELTEDLLLGRWKKLVWNIPYNGLSVILDATTDELMANSYTRALVEKLMLEVQLGAKSTGREIPDSFMQMMLDYTLKMKPYRTSMKIDFDEFRPLEVEAIVGNSIKKAAENNVILPLISGLYQQLKFLDERNSN
ncbi:MAG: putative 2-dehydropantoate 2-reductase [Sphaerospermopsis sp. SIO1G2]|nr:putative 2-dehydropantoate 2-reductase [Sphaerospermopsis sp. SIO1G2]